MSSPSAICTVNGNVLPLTGTTGANVSGSSTITIALANISGIDNWSINCTQSDGLNPNSTYSLIEATKSVNYTNFTATFTAPAASGAIGAALQFISIINAGQWNEDTVTFGVWVLGTDGNRLFFNGENLESNATYGVAIDLNLLSGGGGGTPIPPIVDVTKSPYNADPTGNVDSIIGIQQAIDDMVGTEGGTVYFPPGTYNVSSTLHLATVLSNSGVVTLLGAGSGYSTIINGGLVTMLDAWTVANNNVQIIGLSLAEGRRSNRNAEGTYCIKIDSNILYFRDVAINGYSVGLYVDGSHQQGAYILDGVSINGGSAQGLSLSGAGVQARQLNLNGASANNIKLVTSSNLQMDGGSITGAYQAIYITGASQVVALGTIFRSNTVDVYEDTDSFGSDFSSTNATVIVDNNGGNLPSLMGGNISSGTTIAPTYRLHHVTGTTPIATITVPTNLANTNAPITIALIMDSAGSCTAADNISRAITFTAGAKYIFTYDLNASKWYF